MKPMCITVYLHSHSFHSDVNPEVLQLADSFCPGCSEPKSFWICWNTYNSLLSADFSFPPPLFSQVGMPLLSPSSHMSSCLNGSVFILTDAMTVGWFYLCNIIQLFCIILYSAVEFLVTSGKFVSSYEKFTPHYCLFSSLDIVRVEATVTIAIVMLDWTFIFPGLSDTCSCQAIHSSQAEPLAILPSSLIELANHSLGDITVLPTDGRRISDPIIVDKHGISTCRGVGMSDDDMSWGREWASYYWQHE